MLDIKKLDKRQKTKEVRQKAKQLFLSIFAVLFISASWAQSGLETKELTIKNSFDKLTIRSYAVQGELKVEELFSYLELIQDKNNSVDLNKQISLNIEQLFDEEVLLTRLEHKKYYFSLETWLKDWKSDGIKINSFTLISSQLENTYWIYEYEMNFTQKGKQKTKKVSVTVRFHPQVKTFGTIKKEVWELKIKSVVFK